MSRAISRLIAFSLIIAPHLGHLSIFDFYLGIVAQLSFQKRRQCALGCFQYCETALIASRVVEPFLRQRAPCERRSEGAIIHLLEHLGKDRSDRLPEIQQWIRTVPKIAVPQISVWVRDNEPE
jgi:hypothetical protein